MLIKIFEVLIIPLESMFLFYFLENNFLKINKIFLLINYLLYTIYVFALNIFQVHSAIKVILAIIGIAILIYMCYEMNWLKIASVTCIYLIILGISELFSIGIIMVISQNYDLNSFLNTSFEQFSGTILAKIITFIFLVICKRYQISYSYEKKDIFLVFMPLLLEICLVIFFVYTIFNIDDEVFINALIVISVIVMFETISNILLTEHYLRTKYHMYEFEKMKYIKQNQNKYYASRKESELEIRKIYHDLKNYQIYIESKNKKVDYNLNSLIEPLKRYETFIETNNDILNVVLNEKVKVANKKGIKINCLIDFSRGDFIEPLDICAIFGNLIDNAIEYYDRTSNNISKDIEIKANLINEILVIKVVNNICDKIIVKDGKIVTSKSDKNMHGIGLLSIRESVEKYDGYFNINVYDSKYIATILFPL